MTDQSQPGRQDGDGLRSSYLEMMRAHVDEGGKLSHRNGCDLLTEVERLRATPLSSNGAEGAWRLLPAQPTEAMIEAGVKDHRHEQSFAGAEETYLAMVAAAPAPPQPAPDAMRRSLDKLLEVALAAEGNAAFCLVDTVKQTWQAHARAIRDAVGDISVCLSAPVPPPDGAGEWKPLDRDDTLKILKSFRGREVTIDRAADMIEAHVGTAISSALEMIRSRYAPSGTGAAEPVAFDPTNHHNALKCPYCNPDKLEFTAAPVSGRDALIREAQGWKHENPTDPMQQAWNDGIDERVRALSNHKEA